MNKEPSPARHNFDELLNAALKDYTEQQPHFNLDQRILANLPARRSPFRWRIWASLAVAATSVVILTLAVHPRSTPSRSSIAFNRPPATAPAPAHPAPPMIQQTPQSSLESERLQPRHQPSQMPPPLAAEVTGAPSTPAAITIHPVEIKPIFPDNPQDMQAAGASPEPPQPAATQDNPDAPKPLAIGPISIAAIDFPSLDIAAANPNHPTSAQ